MDAVQGRPAGPRCAGRGLVGMIVAVACWMLVGAGPAGSQDTTLQGTWKLVQYELAGGQVHPLAGTIFFLGDRWQVVFFVLDGQGQPRRASAEGGTYQASGGRLEFHHELHFSTGAPMEGLPAAPLRMETTTPEKAQVEVSRYAVRGDELRVQFPSGNTIVFERLQDHGPSGR